MPSEIADLSDKLEKAEKLFDGCEQLALDPDGVDFAPLALFRQIMQMGDAILILAEARSSVPTFPLLRAMLECYFCLEFIIGQERGEADEWKKSHLHGWFFASIST